MPRGRTPTTLIAQGHGEDIAILCTTSGTTSNPKLAMLSHGRFSTTAPAI